MSTVQVDLFLKNAAFVQSYGTATCLKARCVQVFRLTCVVGEAFEDQLDFESCAAAHSLFIRTSFTPPSARNP